MERISRNQKIEHLELTQPNVPDYFLSLERAVADGLPVDERVAHFYDPGTKQSEQADPLEDFTYWLSKARLDKSLTLGQALNIYGESIHLEHARIDNLVHDFQPKFLERLESLTEQGHIPPVLSERMKQSSPRKFRIAVFDSFAAQKDFGPGRRGPAFYLPNSEATYFRPFNSANEIARQYVHESLHWLSGGSVHLENGLVVSSRTGFGTENRRHRAINEGVIEYLTNLVASGEPGMISAERREQDTGRYTAEREIVQILADRIGLDVILSACSEDFEPDHQNTSQYLREFVSRIRKTYGPGFLRKLDKLDAEGGVQRALDYMRAADYLASNRQRGKRKPHSFDK